MRAKPLVIGGLTLVGLVLLFHERPLRATARVTLAVDQGGKGIVNPGDTVRFECDASFGARARQATADLSALGLGQVELKDEGGGCYGSTLTLATASKNHGAVSVTFTVEGEGGERLTLTSNPVQVDLWIPRAAPAEVELVLEQPQARAGVMGPRDVLRVRWDPGPSGQTDVTRVEARLPPLAREAFDLVKQPDGVFSAELRATGLDLDEHALLACSLRAHDGSGNVGGWSTVPTQLRVDVAPPELEEASLIDRNGNGRADALRLTFDEQVDLDPRGFCVAGIVTCTTADVPRGARFLLPLAELERSSGMLSYAQSGGAVTDLGGVPLADLRRELSEEAELPAPGPSPEQQRLERGLRSLRERLEAMGGAKRKDGVGPALSHEQRVRRELADAALAIAALERKPTAPVQISARERVTEAPATYELTAAGRPRLRALILRNVGSNVVVDPRVTVNGTGDWFDAPSVLAGVVREGMSEREKALAIFSFLSREHVHDDPVTGDAEPHDPVRYLNAYGYGWCDDAASVFVALARHAGLGARKWLLHGHVVAEAEYAGAWHIFDVDGRIHYLDDDGTTIPSVTTLQQRPELVLRRPSPVYTDTELLASRYVSPNSVYAAVPLTPAHTMSFRLLPGESLLRSTGNWGLWFMAEHYEEPKVYGNGRFRLEPEFAGAWREGAEVDSVDVREGRLVSGGGRGTLTWTLDSPYPLVDARVVLRGRGPVSVAFGTDGAEPAEVWRGESGDHDLRLPLRPWVRNGYGRPAYRARVRLVLDAGAQVDAVVVERDVQLAPASLPRLRAGANQVRYVDGSATREVEVGFDYDAGE